MLLRRNPQDIAQRDSTSEIDPDAVLFIAVAGRLTEQGKEWSRHLRDYEAREGVPQTGAGFGWVKTMHPFTLRSLNSPTPEQKEILDAISRAARVLPRQPGAKINAIGLPITDSDMTSAEVEFAGGFLPLELPVPTREPAPKGRHAAVIAALACANATAARICRPSLVSAQSATAAWRSDYLPAVRGSPSTYLAFPA